MFRFRPFCFLFLSHPSGYLHRVGRVFFFVQSTNNFVIFSFFFFLFSVFLKFASLRIFAWSGTFYCTVIIAVGSSRNDFSFFFRRFPGGIFVFRVRQVTGITWDDGCHFCSSNRCEDNTYDYEGVLITDPGKDCYWNDADCPAVRDNSTFKLTLRLEKNAGSATT